MCVHAYLLFLPRLSQLPKPSLLFNSILMLLLQRRLVFPQHLDARQKLGWCLLVSIVFRGPWIDYGSRACRSGMLVSPDLMHLFLCSFLSGVAASPLVFSCRTLWRLICVLIRVQTQRIFLSCTSATGWHPRWVLWEIPVHVCVWCGERKAKLCHGYSGPRGLGSFSLGSILMSKKESHTCHA